MHLISLESISKAYPDCPVLDKASLGIARGQRLGVIGRNGSGKTTLLRIIAGTEHPDDGNIVREGSPGEFTPSGPQIPCLHNRYRDRRHRSQHDRRVHQYLLRH